MGYGYWTMEDFREYSRTQGRAVDAAGRLDRNLNDRQLFTQRGLHPALDPKNVMRECCDSADHPESVPVILALDVTGSMGAACAEVARSMNQVMTKLYETIRDVEFMVMGIGDLSYDRAPIQISQFESDIRIAEQLDHVYIEHGGGGNAFESYTAAWYMGVNHTKLDCWKRGKKGLIITLGDEPMNPYLPRAPLSASTGDTLQTDPETPALYREAREKFDIYHIHVCHRQPDRYEAPVRDSFGKLLPEGHLIFAGTEQVSDTLIRIITDFAAAPAPQPEEPGLIRWDVTPAVPEPKPEPVKKKPKLIFWR